MTEEIWKDVVGYEGKYQVSNFGRVKSVRRNIILAPLYDRDGYVRYNLYDKNGKMRYTPAHRIVALTFLEKPQGCDIVHHIDDNPTNNRVDNLMWVTTQFNLSTEHCKQMHRESLTDEHPFAVYSKSLRTQVYCAETDKVYESMQQASKETGVDTAGIYRVCIGKYKHRKGYHFRYA